LILKVSNGDNIEQLEKGRPSFPFETYTQIRGARSEKNARGKAILIIEQESDLRVTKGGGEKDG